MLLLPGVKRRQPTDRANTELKSKKDLTLHPSFSLHMLARVSSRSHAKVKLMILKLELSLSLSLSLSFSPEITVGSGIPWRERADGFRKRNEH